MQKQTKTKRCVILALMIAVYAVLSSPFMVISIGGMKITFEHFPVVLCAVVYGPIDAILVGGIGELINQMTTFGFTPTTVLWILPIVFRGLAIGLAHVIFSKHIKPTSILQTKFPLVFYTVCVISGLGSSLLNTFALYVDSKLFGYYSYAMVFGSLILRLVLSIITSILIGIIIKPILHALRSARVI